MGNLLITNRVIYVWCFFGIFSALITMFSCCKINAFRIDNWIEHLNRDQENNRCVCTQMNILLYAASFQIQSIDVKHTQIYCSMTVSNWMDITAPSKRFHQNQSNSCHRCWQTLFMLIDYYRHRQCRICCHISFKY